jgi:hypothetical protein
MKRIVHVLLLLYIYQLYALLIYLIIVTPQTIGLLKIN